MKANVRRDEVIRRTCVFPVGGGGHNQEERFVSGGTPVIHQHRPAPFPPPRPDATGAALIGNAW